MKLGVNNAGTTINPTSPFSNPIPCDPNDPNSIVPSSSSTAPPRPVNNFKQRQKTIGCVVISSRSYCLPIQRELRRKISQKN